MVEAPEPDSPAPTPPPAAALAAFAGLARLVRAMRAQPLGAVATSATTTASVNPCGRCLPTGYPSGGGTTDQGPGAAVYGTAPGAAAPATRGRHELGVPSTLAAARSRQSKALGGAKLSGVQHAALGQALGAGATPQRLPQRIMVHPCSSASRQHILHALKFSRTPTSRAPTCARIGAY